MGILAGVGRRLGFDVFHPLGPVTGVGKMVHVRRPRSPHAPLGQQLGVHRTGAVAAEAAAESRPQMIEAEILGASIVIAVEKRTVVCATVHKGLPFLERQKTYRQARFGSFKFSGEGPIKGGRSR
jgi:hypothetical protein